MKKEIVYTDEPMELGPIVEDLLPPPHIIAKAIEKKRLTIQISKLAADFFMEEAKKHRVPYQAMIRNVLDEYVRVTKKRGKAD